jgi:hypothetical protein
VFSRWFAYRDKKVVGVFVRFRAPLPVQLISIVQRTPAEIMLFLRGVHAGFYFFDCMIFFPWCLAVVSEHHHDVFVEFFWTAVAYMIFNDREN